jgi:integrase
MHEAENKRAAKRYAVPGSANLYRDVRTGNYVWRRTDERTGRRVKKSTGTTHLGLARKTAIDFEQDYQKEKVGLETAKDWTVELKPLAEEWIKAQKGEVGALFLPQKEMRILRALRDLGLKTAADLDNVARVHDRLMRLESTGKTRTTLRRAYQDVLRQFASWLAENKRYLERNPLLSWKPIKTSTSSATKPSKKRRALLPDEVARTLLASDRLDAVYGRSNSPSETFLMLLVTASRPGALLSRNVKHFDQAARRVDLGPSVGKKRRGAGALDEKTAAELTASVEGRADDDPLLLSPEGTRPTIERLRDQWREAFGLALVDALWPAGEPRDFEVARFTNRSLFSKRVRVNRGGNPRRKEKLEELGALERSVKRVMDAIGAEWNRRFEGVDVYALRKTHRTWAELRGVPAIIIDKQLGHASAGTDGANEFLRLLQGSETGRKHYLDTDNTLFDASRSAHEVRAFLDETLAKLAQGPTVLLSAPAATLPGAPADAEEQRLG